MKRSDHRITPGRGPGVGARILLLALVPIVGVVMTVGWLGVVGRERVHASEEVHHDIEVLRELTLLHRALTSERLLSVGLVRLGKWGMDESFVRENFGLDAEAMLDESRAEITARLGALDGEGLIDTERAAAELQDLRADTEALRNPASIARRFDALIDEVGAAVDRERLSGTTSSAGRDPQALGASLARLHAALDANRFGALQLSSVTDVWFSDDSTRHDSIIALAQYTAAFERAMTLLRAAPDPGIEEWAAILTTPEVIVYDAAVQGMLRDGRSAGGAGDFGEEEPPAPTRMVEAATTFQGAVLRQDALADLVDMTSDAAEMEAQRVRDEAATQMRQLVVAGTVVVALTVALATWAAFSIARPLRRLIDRTERLRDGDLSPHTARPTGPHDLRRAAATIEDLVDNLRLLDAKAAALARYDLEDPVLQDDLSGPLGGSLQRSTVVLRESITAREELQQRLWHAANHDSLTGIANRSATIEQLRESLANVAPSEHVAVLYVDLDGFKRANDAHGHAVGDEILRVTAARMRDVVRPGDIVGRLGGDEFVVGFSGVTDASVARHLAERLHDVLRLPIAVNGIAVSVGASIGVALGSRGDRPSDVMARADLAVYQAKQGPASVHVYDEALHREVEARTSLERDLSAALGRDDELAVHYQPIVDVYTGDVLRAEALLRWDRPGHGPVSPELFIAAAETTNLIIDVDRWVLTRAMCEAAQWAGESLHDAVGVAINVSGRHVLSDAFVGSVRKALSRSGIEPGRVTLELTESVLVDDLDRAAAHLRAVRDLGVCVYVDDFGTGYTSIAHLHALPIDGIKIDRSFVRALPGTRELTLVRTLIELGLQLGLTVVAEGVETEEQRTIVGSLGCELIQGYLVGRPCPARELAAIVARGPARAGHQ